MPLNPEAFLRRLGLRWGGLKPRSGGAGAKPTTTEDACRKARALGWRAEAIQTYRDEKRTRVSRKTGETETYVARVKGPEAIRAWKRTNKAPWPDLITNDYGNLKEQLEATEKEAARKAAVVDV